MWNWIKRQWKKAWGALGFVRRKLRKAAKYLKQIAEEILPFAVGLGLPWAQKLSAIIGYAQLILNQVEEFDEDTAKEYLQKALDELNEYLEKLGEKLSEELLDKVLSLRDKILELLNRIAERD